MLPHVGSMPTVLLDIRVLYQKQKPVYLLLPAESPHHLFAPKYICTQKSNEEEKRGEEEEEEEEGEEGDRHFLFPFPDLKMMKMRDVRNLEFFFQP